MDGPGTVLPGAIDAIPPEELHADATNKRLLQAAVLRSQLLRLAMKGVTSREAARLCAVSYDTARKHYHDPEFRQAVLSRVEAAFADIDSVFTEKKKTLHERLAEQADRAFEELVAMLDDASTHKALKIKIAQDFLDRNPETQAGSIVRHAQINPDQLANAARAAREMDNVIPFEKLA